MISIGKFMDFVKLKGIFNGKNKNISNINNILYKYILIVFIITIFIFILNLINLKKILINLNLII